MRHFLQEDCDPVELTEAQAEELENALVVFACGECSGEGRVIYHTTTQFDLECESVGEHPADRALEMVGGRELPHER